MVSLFWCQTFNRSHVLCFSERSAWCNMWIETIMHEMGSVMHDMGLRAKLCKADSWDTDSICHLRFSLCICSGEFALLSRMVERSGMIDIGTASLQMLEWRVIDYNADSLIKKGSCQSTLDANRKLFWSVFLLSFMTPCQCVCCSCPSSTNAPCDSTCYSEGAILYRATCLDSMGGCGLEESVFLNSCQLAACQHVNHINSM